MREIQLRHPQSRKSIKIGEGINKIKKLSILLTTKKTAQ